MLSTERRRHDVLVMFGDVSYDVRNAHWRVNNKIKRKFPLFQWTPKKFSSRVMKTFTFSLVIRTRENTDVFITLDENIHSKRVNILYIYCGKFRFMGMSPPSWTSPLVADRRHTIKKTKRLHVLKQTSTCLALCYGYPFETLDCWGNSNNWHQHVFIENGIKGTIMSVSEEWELFDVALIGVPYFIVSGEISVYISGENKSGINH